MPPQRPILAYRGVPLVSAQQGYDRTLSIGGPIALRPDDV